MGRGGLTAGAYTTAAAEHGLATGFGDTGSVGLGGLTLGGGVGYLVRKYGLTIDNLLAAEIVTADGEVRIVDAETTSRTSSGPSAAAAATSASRRGSGTASTSSTAWSAACWCCRRPPRRSPGSSPPPRRPDELSTIANVMSCPPMPFVPEEYHGSS